MKTPLLLALLFCVFLAGCATEGPPPPRVFMGIADAYKVGDGPAETSKYSIVVHYENVDPGQYEVKIGFGYVPSSENANAVAPDASGFYAVAHSEVLQQPSGDIRVTLEPTTVRNLRAKLDGRIHAILSPYPHGKEWIIARHDIFVLPPE